MSETPSLTPFGDAIAGAGGAIVALTTVYPLDMYCFLFPVQLLPLSPTSPESSGPFSFSIKTRLQVQSKATRGGPEYKSSLDALLKIFRTEGLEGLYAGLPAGLVGVASTNFAYFYCYSSIRSAYVKRVGVHGISTGMELVLGALAGVLAQIFTIPVSVVVTRQQTMPREERLTFDKTWAQIVNEDGYRGLWKGLKPSLILVANPAITYGLYQRIKSVFVLQNLNLGSSDPDTLSSFQSFMVGIISKSIATVVTYPYIMAKVRLQWKAPKALRDSGEHKKFTGAVDVLKRTFKDEGLIGWYKGLQPQLSKAVLSQAILFVSKDKLAGYTLMLFALFSKRSRTKDSVAMKAKK